MAGSPGWLAKFGAAAVTLISIAQVVLRLGAHAGAHSQWLKRWCALHNEISLKTEPDEADIARWTQERTAIETECVGELRALCLDCENAAARVLEVPGRQVQISPLQRLLIHFGTFQGSFPRVEDTAAPARGTQVGSASAAAPTVTEVAVPSETAKLEQVTPLR